MTGQNRKEERDEVLLAFHRECERPTAEQVLAWVERYPDYAEDIRAHAAVALDLASAKGPLLEASQSLLDRTYSNALNALYNADQKAASAGQETVACSFHDLAAARGKEVFEIAKEIGIGRAVIADLFNGWMLPPVRRRVAEAVCQVLQITQDVFDSALSFARANPRLGYAKANKTPTVVPRSCDDIIRSSNTPPERQRFFLEED